MRFSVTVCVVPGGMSLLTLPSSSVKLCSAAPSLVIETVTVPAPAVNTVGVNEKSFAVSESEVPDPPLPVPAGVGVVDELLEQAASSTTAAAADMRLLLTRPSFETFG